MRERERERESEREREREREREGERESTAPTYHNNMPIVSNHQGKQRHCNQYNIKM